MVSLPVDPRSEFVAEKALGAAYWRSPAARARSLDIVRAIDASDPVTFDPIADYDALENAIALGTKRNPRRPTRSPWERHLTSAETAALQGQRQTVEELEVLYENLQTVHVHAQLASEKIALERLVSRLMRRVLEAQVTEKTSLAQDHALAWNVFSSMTSKRSSVPIPPSTLVEHFENVMAPKSENSAIYPSFVVPVGPLSREDVELSAPFSSDELNEAIRKMNMDSAPGPDGLTPNLVKDLFSLRAFFVYFLMYVNFCLENAWIPLAWRCSEIFILYKGKGDPFCADSYRGIALCCILAKVFERLLLFRLLRWWRSSPLFHLSQFGFRAGSSTTDAVFVLQSLVNFVCRVNRSPLHACFIDLKKAFPSVSRPALFQHLISLGVPWPLVAAIRSFYQLNVARLRVGSFLSRKFLVTLGLLEGSILSPMLFSILFSFVWHVIGPSNFPGVNSVLKIDDVWVLAFADDLVILSPSRARIVEVLGVLDREFLKFNLKMNFSKTEVMTFRPRGRRAVPDVSPPIVLNSHSLTEVSTFRYLGVQISNLCTFGGHVELILQRSKVSLHKTVNLLRQLQITSIPRLHCYFLSFVQAQFYGLEILPHTASLLTGIENTRNTYMKFMFNLPPGTPSELFYVIWPSFHPSLLCLQRRLTFFQRGLKHSLACVISSFMFNLSLFSRNSGWFRDSFLFYQVICPHSRMTTFDFARDVPALFDVVRNEEFYSFSYVRASKNVCMSFFREVRRAEGLVKFREALSQLSHHHQHVILCFASSQMRWTFLSSPRRLCPHCTSSWHWNHFFSCPHLSAVLSSRGLSLTKLRCDVSRADWNRVFVDIAHVLIVWSFSLNGDPNISLSYDVDCFRTLMHQCQSS